MMNLRTTDMPELRGPDRVFKAQGQREQAVAK